MTEYTEENLPVTLHPDDLLRLNDGTTIRFDVNGEGKDIMLNDDFGASCELYPGNEFLVGGVRLTTQFEEVVKAEKA